MYIFQNNRNRVRSKLWNAPESERRNKKGKFENRTEALLLMQKKSFKQGVKNGKD